MTIEEAREEIPRFEVFAEKMCSRCANLDCFGLCADLCAQYQKVKIIAIIDFKRIQKAYARHNGDIVKVVKFIDRAKFKRS